jgi:predicted DNA-binding transcriptional regulator AlpA
MGDSSMSAVDVADALGRSVHWLYEHRQRLVAEERMPPPLHAGAMPLTWNTAQINAWLDRNLSKELQVTCAAYRAAVIAAKQARNPASDDLTIADARSRLDQRFSGKQRAQ